MRERIPPFFLRQVHSPFFPDPLYDPSDPFGVRFTVPPQHATLSLEEADFRWSIEYAV